MKIDLVVLAAVADHFYEEGAAPSIREICMRIGYPSTKEVWWALQRLEAVGVIRWPKDDNGRRIPRGLELNIPLVTPVEVPILGPVEGPPARGYVPGSAYVEIHKDGSAYVVGSDGRRTSARVIAVS